MLADGAAGLKPMENASVVVGVGRNKPTATHGILFAVSLPNKDTHTARDSSLSGNVWACLFHGLVWEGGGKITSEGTSWNGTSA